MVATIVTSSILWVSVTVIVQVDGYSFCVLVAGVQVTTTCKGF
jgi:hypothetical protein